MLRWGWMWGCVLAAFIICAVQTELAAAGRDSGAAARPVKTPRVVSYLVSDAGPPEAWFGDPPSQPAPTDWRVYDPRTGREFPYLRLPSVPTRIRWEPSFRFVEYKLGDRVYRASWGANPNLAEVLRLPADSTICDFWEELDPGLWWCTRDRHLPEFRRGGYLYTPSLGEVWTSSDRGSHWVLTRADSCWREEGCECVQNPWRASARTSRVRLEDLLDSMRVEHHSYRVLTHFARDSEAEALVTTPCAWDSTCRLEFSEGFGDTDHAMAPLVYVNATRGIRKAVYEVPDTSLSLGQIGFQEEGPFLLVAGEYVSTDPAIIDLRNGKTILTRSDRAFGAVWVPWPSSGP
jgi:hypothetical protein